MVNNNKKIFGIMTIIAVCVVVVVAIGIAATKDIGKSSGEITRTTALEDLTKKLNDIDISNVEARKANVEIGSTSLQDELPDISKYPLSVEGYGQINIEVFSSTEKSSGGTDGWLNEVAERFNSSGYTIDGQSVSISVRPIASGLAVDYIVSGKHVPQVYTPSNTLWGEMIASQNVDIDLTETSLVGNTAGILMSNETYDVINTKYGSVNLDTLVKATVDNTIAMGYTNPYASSAGLNFLISALYSFDSTDPLSATSIDTFTKFQENVPFVAYTTLQMREAVDTGVLDAFILEYQTVLNDSSLRNYKFIPFGVRHDNPVYSIGKLSPDEAKAISEFVSFCKNTENQQLAEQYGFNKRSDYVSDVPETNGATLLSAQKLWKNEKDAGKPVIAVFVADVSGSMDGEPITELKRSLINASQYISSSNYIGLVSYSNDVDINLPIEEFTLNHRSYFTGAVEDLSASGGTATYDAVLVAADMLVKAQEQHPDAKLMMFVLSDGETNNGHSFNQIEGIIQGLEIPVYTIGYNANIAALEELSSINEAASINADSDDVVYKLKSLFNAQI